MLLRKCSKFHNIEKWAFEWGFMFSVDKSKTMFFERKKICPELKLSMYGKELKRVDCFKYLGLWFDKMLTWASHVQKVVDKCKSVLNVMRCLRGVEWGASSPAMKTIYRINKISV